MVFVLIFGLGALCVLMYNCAVYAVPFAIGMWTFFGILHLGGGYLGAIIFGLFAGGFSFGLFQFAFSHARSNIVRYLIVSAFVVPAIIAGYSAGLQLSEFAISSSTWQHIYAVISAIAVGYSAFLRLATPIDFPSSDTSVRNGY